MNYKQFLFSGLLVLLVALMFGCTGTTICGDQICSTGEDLTCPTDCAAPVEAKVIVNVNGAYDATGDLSLRWHHSKDVFANANASIVSRLGEHWSGEQVKNLSISFNDSISGEVPLEQYGNRTVTLNITQPGDYYFEALSEDYAYRVVSDKITITESKEYYVNMNLTVGNPAVRVKAYDTMTGNVLTGRGKISVYAEENYYEYGENKKYEYLYSEMNFDEGQEVNGLFFLYNYEDKLNNRYVSYRAVVEAEGYDGTKMNVYPYGKYQEFGVWLNKTGQVLNGSLKITIVPGIGTTQEDVASLEGRNVQVNGGCVCTETECTACISKDVTIQNGMIILNDYPYGSYSVYIPSGMNNNSPDVPIGVESKSFEIIAGEGRYDEIKALKGYNLNLKAVDINGQVVDPTQIEMISFCQSYLDQNYCSEYNGESWANTLVTNPYVFAATYYSEEHMNQYAQSDIVFTTKYNNDVQATSFSINQGFNDILIQYN